MALLDKIRKLLSKGKAARKMAAKNEARRRFFERSPIFQTLEVTNKPIVFDASKYPDVEKEIETIRRRALTEFPAEGKFMEWVCGLCLKECCENNNATYESFTARETLYPRYANIIERRGLDAELERDVRIRYKCGKCQHELCPGVRCCGLFDGERYSWMNSGPYVFQWRIVRERKSDPEINWVIIEPSVDLKKTKERSEFKSIDELKAARPRDIGNHTPAPTTTPVLFQTTSQVLPDVGAEEESNDLELALVIWQLYWERFPEKKKLVCNHGGYMAKKLEVHENDREHGLVDYKYFKCKNRF